MTTGELLNMLEEDAREYRSKALNNIQRNREYYELAAKDVRRIRRRAKQYQRIVDAILADFINEVALRRGLNRGELVRHLKE